MGVDLLVLGGSGLLGSELRFTLAERGTLSYRLLAHGDCDIADPSRVRAVIGASAARWVVNCAAYNAVDMAEKEPDLAMRVNATAPGVVAGSAKAIVHFSTDFVFDGEKRTPYVETDPPRPLSAYARSKHAGDQAVAATNAQYIILRVGCLYGVAGRGFGSKLLQNLRAGKRVSADGERQIQPTWGRSVATQLLALLNHPRWGLFHAMAHGSTTWAEFGREMARMAGLDARLINAVQTSDLKAPAPRPRYAVLENRALAALGLDQMPTWQKSLEGYLASVFASQPSGGGTR